MPSLPCRRKAIRNRVHEVRSARHFITQSVLPTAVIRKKCDKLVAINMNAVPELALNSFNDTLKVLSRALRLSISNQSTFKANECDLLITPLKIAEYPMFSKESVDELYKIGYKEGLKNIAALKSLID